MEARLMRETRAALTTHVGGAPSVAQQMLIERAAQLQLRLAMFDRTFAKDGADSESASKRYVAWSASLSRTLRILGVQAVASRPLTTAERLARPHQAAAA
jgi:hypothetical protein